jgi:glycine hydroxymethyltransferase
MIIAGGSAYPRIIDFVRFSKIAKSVNALLFVDMAHIAGLVAGGAHPSPFPYADVVATTTHKTMRGPRGGVILTNNEDYAKAINKAVFPGMQGGPHDNNTAAKAICFAEALEPSFNKYAKNVVDNAKILAETINKANTPNNSMVFSGGTDNHLLLVDVTPFGISGKTAQEILDTIHITVNKQMLPGDTRKPSDPSGIRLGSPAMTTRGFGKKEFTLVGKWIVNALANPEDIKLHKKLAKEVTALCKQFPLPH